MGQFFGGIGYLFNLIFTYPIFNGLMLLYHLFGDFGLSIVVLTLTIKLVLFPLTLQQLKSMKANQALQPQMQEIRKKYAKDQQAQMQAMQALYKEYGVSPMSGCLPMFIQLPVLYGLYYALNDVLRNSNHNVESINSHLYPFVTPFQHFPNVDLNWFTWLSFLNPIFHLHWSWSISLGVPDPTHVLPILAGLATFIQLRMSQPKTNPATAKAGKSDQPDPTQQTMKTMQYIMPLFTVFIGWTFPAGLALYWTVSSIFQAVQQYFVTGWGSLLTTPNLKSKSESNGSVPALSTTSSANSTKTSTSKGRSEVAREVKPVDESDEDEEAENEPSNSVASNMRTTPAPRPGGNGSSQSARRSRSASGRRRGGAQRSRR